LKRGEKMKNKQKEDEKAQRKLTKEFGS